MANLQPATWASPPALINEIIQSNAATAGGEITALGYSPGANNVITMVNLAKAFG
jgi:hypothetical protein